MRQGIACSLLFLTLFLSCKNPGKRVAAADLSDPRQYFLHLCDYLRKGSGQPKDWCEEVTRKYCEKGNEFLAAHHTIWKAEILRFVDENFDGNPEKVKVALEGEQLFLRGEGVKEMGFRVALEGGRLRINEN